LILPDQSQRLDAITGFGDDFQFCNLVELRTNSTTYEGAVVRYQNPNLFHWRIIPLVMVALAEFNR
jgi:hypothetical protein